MQTSLISELQHSKSALSLAVLGAHLCAASWGFLADPLLLATCAASAVMWLAIWTVSSFRESWRLLFVAAFISGNVLTLAYGNYAYVEFTTLPRGMRHDLTSWLVALLSASALAGGVLAHSLLHRIRSTELKPDNLYRHPLTPWVWGGVFLAIALLQVAIGALESRWTPRENASTGLTYLVTAISLIGYPFFFILGSRLKGSPFSARNLLLIGVLLTWMVLKGTTGGREGSLWMLLLFCGGALTANIRRSHFLILVIAGALLGGLFIAVIGEVRSNSSFRNGSVQERVSIMGEAVSDPVSSEQDSGTQRVIDRVYEFSAQVVIDVTSATRSRAGFQNFDRLKYIWLPRFVAPEKANNSPEDGPETLARDYGFHMINEYTSVPITLVADAYRRGGATWVGIVGLLGGIWLRFLMGIVTFAFRGEFAYAALAVLCMFLVRCYTPSVLGFIWRLGYFWFRNAILLFGTYLFVRMVVTILSSKPRTSPHAAALVRQQP